MPTATPTPTSVRQYTYRVVHSYPHDAGAFTEGLAFDGGFLYEGTGINGKSSLRRVEIATGQILQSKDLTAQFFGEGIAVYKDRIVQLTWQSHVGFVYDKNSFDQIGTFSYPTDAIEGWGIAYDGQRLIMSDGSATLHFLNPDTLAETGSVAVTENNALVTNLNELEFVDGVFYANVWLTNYIVMISPDTGKVIGRVDLKGLADSLDKSLKIDVLNGIAYDPAGNRLFVTGKLWPTLFEITLAPAN